MKLQVRKLPHYDEQEYLMSDDTRMRVCMCSICKADIDNVDTKEIMKKVVKGWEWGIDNNLKWDKDKKKKYMDKYGKLKITGRYKKEK